MASRVRLKQLQVLDLLGLHSEIITELCERGVLRSVNNPVADYAEFLVTKALSLRPRRNQPKDLMPQTGGGGSTRSKRGASLE